MLLHHMHWTYKSIQGSQKPHEKNQGMWVVLDMTQGLCGHNIICDIFITHHTLGQELLKMKLTMVGIL